MYILDFPYVVGFGKIEYDIFIKMLKNESDLTEEEEGRADQMLQTAVRMKKIKSARSRPRHHRDSRQDCRIHRRADVTQDGLEQERNESGLEHGQEDATFDLREHETQNADAEFGVHAI